MSASGARTSGPFIQTSASGLVAEIRAGKIRAYAVTSSERIASAPQIPSVDEAGAPGLHIAIWHGLWAPKGTAAPVIAKLNVAAVEALADPRVRQRFAEMGQDIPLLAQQTPAALAAFQRAEIAKWWPIIKTAGIQSQ